MAAPGWTSSSVTTAAHTTTRCGAKGLLEGCSSCRVCSQSRCMFCAPCGVREHVE
jgi:hypothetical protein